MTLTFGGISYPIDSDQFNAGSVDTSGKLCLGAVFALETGSSTISVIIGECVLLSSFSSLHSSATKTDSFPLSTCSAFLTGVYNAYRFSSPAAVGFATLGSGGTSNTGSSTVASSGTSGASSVVIGTQSLAKGGVAVALVAVAAAVFA
jgi:cathepsin D